MGCSAVGTLPGRRRLPLLRGRRALPAHRDQRTLRARRCGCPVSPADGPRTELVPSPLDEMARTSVSASAGPRQTRKARMPGSRRAGSLLAALRVCTRDISSQRTAVGCCQSDGYLEVIGVGVELRAENVKHHRRERDGHSLRAQENRGSDDGRRHSPRRRSPGSLGPSLLNAPAVSPKTRGVSSTNGVTGPDADDQRAGPMVTKTLVTVGPPRKASSAGRPAHPSQLDRWPRLPSQPIDECRR